MVAETIGDSLFNSETASAAIDAIVAEVQERRRGIDQVRGPRAPELTQRFEEYLQSGGECRGRPLVYPLIGSGIGNGPFIELLDGSVKYDMITGIGVHFFGHSDPELVRAALTGAMSDIAMQGNLLMNREVVDFARTVVEQAGRDSRLAHTFLCNSGAVANESALKICYQKNAPASRVLAFAHCFTGRTITMAQIGDSAAGRQGLPLTTPVDYLPFYDRAQAGSMSAGDASGSTRFIEAAVRQLQQYIDRYPAQHACFAFELLQGEGGFNTAPAEFHRALMEVCRDHGIGVWVDEVQSFGRTEAMFCFQALGLGEYIDVCTIGKMSQVCAAIYTADYNPRPGLLSATFVGSTMSLHVGKRIIERLAQGDYYGSDGRIARHHRRFRAQAEALAARHPEWFPQAAGQGGWEAYPSGEENEPAARTSVAGGIGGMMRFTPFGGEKDAVLKLCRQMFDDGVITFYCGHGPYHVRMLPPLGVMQEQDWGRIFEIVEQSMATVAGGLPEGAAGAKSKLQPAEARAKS